MCRETQSSLGRSLDRSRADPACEGLFLVFADEKQSGRLRGSELHVGLKGTMHALFLKDSSSFHGDARAAAGGNGIARSVPAGSNCVFKVDSRDALRPKA